MLHVECLLLPAEAVPAADHWLAPAEAEVLAGLHLPRRRADWRLGRYAAKRLLAAQRATPPALSELAVLAAPDGAPEVLLRGEPLPLTLSLSHRDGLALCAVAAGRVGLGCDLERVEPRSAALVDDFFTAAERARVLQAPEAERALLANLVWSAKESALKLLREGLRLDTRRVEVEGATGYRLPATGNGGPHPPAPSPAGGRAGGAQCRGRGRSSPAAGSRQPTADDRQPTADSRQPPSWQPLTVRHAERRLHGWWRRHEGWVLTLVAEPAPEVPRLVVAPAAGSR